MRRIGCILFAVSLLFVNGCVTQTDMDYVYHRLSALERQNAQESRDRAQVISQVSDVDKARADTEQSLREQAAQLRVRVDQLTEDVAKLTGKVEEAEFLLAQRIKALEAAETKRRKAMADLQATSASDVERLTQVERYLNLEPQTPGQHSADATPPAASASAPPASMDTMTEQALYALSKKQLDEREYEKARGGFLSFIKRFPRSEQADNAQFWIGETYYREKWYEKAILEYQTVIERYPKGNKVPAALLKQGLAFYLLKDTANARLILKELVKKFPETNEAAVARRKLEP